MNTPIPTSEPIPAAAETLPPEVSHLEKIRQQLANDIEALRQKEANMRRAEEQAPAVGTAAIDRLSLDAERDKLARLRALTEAERRALVDERLAVREEKALLARKAEELKQREAWLDAREKDAAANAGSRKPKAKVTRPPFTARIFSFGTKRPVA